MRRQTKEIAILNDESSFFSLAPGHASLAVQRDDFLSRV